MSCPECEGKNHKNNKHFPNRGFTIINPSEYVLLRKTVIPSSLGDETAVPAKAGKYKNTIVEYEVNSHVYIYSSDGVPTRVDGGVVLDSTNLRVAELEKLTARIEKLEEANKTMAKEIETLKGDA